MKLWERYCHSRSMLPGAAAAGGKTPFSHPSQGVGLNPYSNPSYEILES